jgi:hypothetical protein
MYPWAEIDVSNMAIELWNQIRSSRGIWIPLQDWVESRSSRALFINVVWQKPPSCQVFASTT